MKTDYLFLAIDVGTGSIRSALVNSKGQILAFSQKEHEQIALRHSWSEQRPMDWWNGTKETILDVLSKVEDAADRVVAIGACGQMHGVILIDEDGNLTRNTALLWNDKRTLKNVQEFECKYSAERYFSSTANMPTPAWPAFKLMWIAQNDPTAIQKAASLLMPKDYINFRFTGVRAHDWTEASMSFMMDANTSQWSNDLADLTGVSLELLPDIKDPASVLAGLSEKIARQLGLKSGTPVVVGCGDYPMALLGSGVTKSGMASDVTGTSTIITMLHDNPILDAEISNIKTSTGVWGSFTLLDAGGDAVRWARRAFHENQLSYHQVEEAAAGAEPGSNGLFFLPYLSGERFGNARNSRAQFFGISATHGLQQIHRAILEGIAFSVRHRLGSIQGDKGRPKIMVASGGGAKSDIALKIKASMYDTPYLVPEELECGIVGCAAIMSVATGKHSSIEDAVKFMVRYSKKIEPNPELVDLYNHMMPIYEDIYHNSQAFYDRLDALNFCGKK